MLLSHLTVISGAVVKLMLLVCLACTSCTIFCLKYIYRDKMDLVCFIPDSDVLLAVIMLMKLLI